MSVVHSTRNAELQLFQGKVFEYRVGRGGLGHSDHCLHFSFHSNEMMMFQIRGFLTR